MKRANRILIAVIVMVMSISFAAAANKYHVTPRPDQGEGVVQVCTDNQCMGLYDTVVVTKIPGSAEYISDTEAFDISSGKYYKLDSTTSDKDASDQTSPKVEEKGGVSPDLGQVQGSETDGETIETKVYVNGGSGQPLQGGPVVPGTNGGQTGGQSGGQTETFTVKLSENGDYQIYSNVKGYGDYYMRNEVSSTDEIPGFSDLKDKYKISDTEYFDPGTLRYFVVKTGGTPKPSDGGGNPPQDTSEQKPNLLTVLHKLGSWGSAAAGWEWGVNQLFPEVSKELRQAFALDSFTLPSTFEEAYCAQVTQPEANANDQTMLGTEAGQLPSLMLQAIRSTAIKYPKETTTTILPTAGMTTTTETTTTVEDDVLTEGIVPSPTLPLYGTRYYTKITLRYQGIIDPLLIGKDKTYELHMYGFIGSIKKFIDLDPESDKTYLEMSDGSYSLSGKNAIVKYIKYKLDKVCVEFVDNNYVLDPLFLKKLTNNMFCTPVVEVKDKWLEYEKPQVTQGPENPDDVV